MSITRSITLQSVDLAPGTLGSFLTLRFSEGDPVTFSLRAELSTGLTLRETALALNEATLELMRRHREEQAALTTPLPLEPVDSSAPSP